MDEIINKVLNIEDRAQKLIEDTKREQESIQKEYNQKIEDLKKDISARADKKIETIRNTESSDAQKICKTIEENAKQSVQKLTSLEAQKKDEWVETIYQNIIGR